MIYQSEKFLSLKKKKKKFSYIAPQTSTSQD